MTKLRNDPQNRGVETPGALPPVVHDNPVPAEGRRLIATDRLDERRVTEVRTDDHGVLAVGLTPDGTPFAVSNLCRHQFGKLGRGRVTDDGCLQCPWHRADYDVVSGAMTSGPKGRIFGFKPYSALVNAFGRVAKLRTFPVEVRDGAIWLTQLSARQQAVGSDRARRRLAKYADLPFTYQEVGATAGGLPSGYDHHRKSKMIGTGRDRFVTAANAVLGWAMQRATGLGVTASAPQAEPEAVVVVGRGPVRAPCRVIYVIDEPDRRGFAYGTLPGHPEAGEECFAVRYDAVTDQVFAEVVAFSRPGTWWSKAVAPVTRVLAGVLMNRYLKAV
jgi:3-phenylpropionate/trans-cinnamate dioxygenase ferredoxin component